MSTAAITGLPENLTTEEIHSMGIETALLAVQYNRATLMEDLLKGQMVALQEKNAQVAKLNTLMAAVNVLIGKFAAGATPTQNLGIDGHPAEKAALVSALAAVGYTAQSLFGVELTLLQKSHLDGAATKLKSEIDNLSSTQQLDMLRVQSISNKRNEAFEMMTTFIKKFSDMLSAIIRNMA